MSDITEDDDWEAYRKKFTKIEVTQINSEYTLGTENGTDYHVYPDGHYEIN